MHICCGVFIIVPSKGNDGIVDSHDFFVQSYGKCRSKPMLKYLSNACCLKRAASRKPTLVVSRWEHQTEGSGYERLDRRIGVRATLFAWPRVRLPSTLKLANCLVAVRAFQELVLGAVACDRAGLDRLEHCCAPCGGKLPVSCRQSCERRCQSNSDRKSQPVG